MFHIVPILILLQINSYTCKVRYIQFFMVWTKNSGTAELFSHTLFTWNQIEPPGFWFSCVFSFTTPHMYTFYYKGSFQQTIQLLNECSTKASLPSLEGSFSLAFLHSMLELNLLGILITLGLRYWHCTMEVHVLGKQVLSAFLAFAVAIGLLWAFSVSKYLDLTLVHGDPKHWMRMQEKNWGIV